MSEPGFTFTSDNVFGLPYSSIKGKPYITVSAKGLANGTSNIPNDGADFGPDSLQADGSATQTSGIMEAINNAPVGGIVQLIPGAFNISASITISKSITIRGFPNIWYFFIPTASFNLNNTANIKQTTDNPTFNILNTSSETIFVILDGIFMTGTNNASNTNDIAISTAGSTEVNMLQISNCTMFGNYQGINATAYYDSVVIDHVNIHSFYNWAIYMDNSDVSRGLLKASELHINDEPVYGSASGGIIFSGAEIDLFDCVIEGIMGAECLNLVAMSANTSARIHGCHFNNGSSTHAAVRIGAGGLTNGAITFIDCSLYQQVGTGYNWEFDNTTTPIQNVYIIGGFVNTGAGSYNITTGTVLKNVIFKEVNGITNLTSSTAGTTAGTVDMHTVDFSPQSYKKYAITFSGYENDTTTNQTIDFPQAFTSYAGASLNTTGLTIAVTTSGITITAPDSTTTYSGIVIVEGY